MKKRGLLCFLLVLCILIIANIASADTLIETGWYRNGDSVVVNKLVLTIYLSETREKVLLSYDSEIKSLKLGTCMIDESLKICLVDFRDGDDLAANIDIYSVKPELSITRTFNATEFFIGDHVEAVVKIKNQGTKEASDVLFEEVFPSGIEIFDSDGTIVNKTSTRWTGDIGIGKEEEIKYEFFATREIDAREKATLTHDSTTYFSKTQNLKAKSCYEYSASFNLTNVTVGSTFDFNFTIENKINKTLEINYVKAYFPDSVDVKGDMSKVGSFWQWSKNISGNSKRDSENSLMPKRSFRLQFPIRIGATCKDIFYEKEYFEEFEVQKPLLVIRTSIDDINQTEFGFHELELDEAYLDDVIFRIQKPTKGLVYSNVNVTVSTDLDFDKGKELNFFLGKLESIDNVKIGEARLIVPLVDSKKIFFMNITASYVTQFGEVVVQQKDYEITVQPIRNIRITHEFSKRSIEEGSYQNITVKAENLRETDLKSVRFEDYIVYGDVSEKLKSRTIDIEKGQERTVYEYNIVVPRVSKPTSITIETMVEYSENGREYSFTKSRTFSAEPKKLDISVEPKIKGDSFTGKAFDIEYIVENNEDEEPAYNIVLHFPLQQDTDVIGLENFTINELSPGERIVLTDVGKIRPKFARETDVTEFLVEYEDSDRNVFNLSSKSDSDDVKSSFLIGPVLMGYKNASKDRLVLGDTFKLELVVENIGNEPASARIFDLNKSWEFTLLPGRKRSLTFDYIADVTGRYEIPGAVIKYSSLNETYTTISNSVSVRVSAPEEPVVEEPPAIFVFAQERLKINPLATLVLITLVILTSVVAWIYFRESRQYKKPLKYSEKEKKWVRY